MYTITVQTEFSAAHRLTGYRGKCENLHGHNWTVSVTVCCGKLDKNGMVMDFASLKKMVSSELEKLDHVFLNELSCFQDKNPTSENIARFIYDSLKKKCKGVIKVTVWETAASCASYEE